MDFAIEQECPQCGGAIVMDEADRLFRCPYCGVASFLANTDPFCFVLPTRAQSDEVLYVPFIRFRGAVYTCQGLEISHRLLDVTHLGFPHPLLPVSLGFRPQVMKMRFVSPKLEGAFLPCRLSLEEALARMNGNPLRTAQARVYHRAHIGETFSYIYLPTARRGPALCDLVTEAVLGTLADGQDAMLTPAARPAWHPFFLPALCPGCGADLAGANESVVLFCQNCESAWEPGKSGFQPLAYETPFADLAGAATVLLPFWCLSATGKHLQTFADFMRLTNQPKIIAPAWESRPLTFITPAFKLRPKTYLRLAGQLTLAQAGLAGTAAAMKKNPLPVNLAKSEAVESLKIILAATAVAKKNIMPLLPELNLQTQGITLLLIPFQDTGATLYQAQLDINISRQELGFGQSL